MNYSEGVFCFRDLVEYFDLNTMKLFLPAFLFLCFFAFVLCFPPINFSLTINNFSYFNVAIIIAVDISRILW